MLEAVVITAKSTCPETTVYNEPWLCLSSKNGSRGNQAFIPISRFPYRMKACIFQYRVRSPRKLSPRRNLARAIVATVEGYSRKQDSFARASARSFVMMPLWSVVAAISFLSNVTRPMEV